MSDNLINRRDLEFMLYELLDVTALCERPRFADHDRGTFDGAIETALQVALDHFAPHNAKADHEEPHFDGENVHIIPEVKQAVDAFAEAGLLAAEHDYEIGGMQLPASVTNAIMGIFHSANVSTAAYPFLTMAAANMLLEHGSQEQIGLFLEAMLSGRFSGTMCLSEPQAGSSLSDIRTKATPSEEGHYLIAGTKMWISGGEHELTENIVHMVLARIDGAPDGVKGISLFIVPKYLVDPDRSVGARNGVKLAGLNHKMGYRGTVNTVLTFGEDEACIGYLLGAPNQGLGVMFHMMNEARIGIGLGATMLGYRGYLESLAYARERPQGRHPGAKDPSEPQLAIIQHADVKRMLLAQKAYCEGALALCLFAARLVDEQKSSEHEAARSEAGLLLEVLTPVVKAWPSEWCLEANKWAIQILGGYGYTRDFPIEQLYRDNRLNMIHEGTNGIQAIDLLGRKVAMADGAGMERLGLEIDATIEAAAEEEELEDMARQLARAAQVASTTTGDLLACARRGQVRRYLANAHVFLNMMGRLIIAWMWLKQAIVAVQGLAAAESEGERDFYSGKLQTCQYYFRYELPYLEAEAGLLSDLDETTLDMENNWF